MIVEFVTTSNLALVFKYGWLLLVPVVFYAINWCKKLHSFNKEIDKIGGPECGSSILGNSSMILSGTKQGCEAEECTNLTIRPQLFHLSFEH